MKLLRSVGKASALFTLAVLSTSALGLLKARSAHAAPIIYTFVDNTPFDSNAPANTTWSVGGLTMTSVAIRGPVYRTDGVITTGGAWDGIEMDTATTNINTTAGGLVVNGPNGGRSVSDTSRWEVAEEWTFKFSDHVIFRGIDLASFSAAGDKLDVTIHSSTPANFVFTTNEPPSNPFGENYVIPAGTEITFKNPPLPGSPPSAHSDWWALVSLTVEVQQVPEPSSILMIVLGSSGVGMLWLRRRKQSV